MKAKKDISMDILALLAAFGIGWWYCSKMKQGTTNISQASVTSIGVRG